MGLWRGLQSPRRSFCSGGCADERSTLAELFEAGRALCAGAGVGPLNDAAPVTADSDDLAWSSSRGGFDHGPAGADHSMAGLTTVGAWAEHLGSLGFAFDTQPEAPPVHVQLLAFLGDWYLAATTGHASALERALSEGKMQGA